MGTRERPDQFHEVPSAEIERIGRVLRSVAGRDVSWGAVNVLDIWMAEKRLEAERLSSRRLLIATWVLVFATLGLVVATIALVIVAP